MNIPVIKTLRWLYPDYDWEDALNPPVVVRQDGAGDQTIVEWNLAESQPTDQELIDTYNANQAAIEQNEADQIAEKNAWLTWLADHPAVVDIFRMQPDEIEATIAGYDISQLRQVIIAQAVVLSGLTRLVLK